MPRSRKTNRRQVKKRILIICEGERTEPLYFNAYKRDNRHSLSGLEIVIADTKKNTPRELVREAVDRVREAKKERNSYDEAWTVFDRNGYTLHHEAFDLAKQKGIKIAFSSISFEVWYLLHFTYSTAQDSSAAEVISKLKRHYLTGYKKNQCCYKQLADHIETAKSHAEKLRRYHQEANMGDKIYTLNPYTNVDLLIASLESKTSQ